MKVSVEITPGCEKPFAVIYTDRITEEIQYILDMFQSSDSPVTAMSNENIIILLPKEIYLIRVENGESVIYGQKESFYSRKRLYELKDQLGNRFMQISKSAIINLSYMDSIEAGFSGTMLLKMKNGTKEYVSRKYLPEFKKYLGL